MKLFSKKIIVSLLCIAVLFAGIGFVVIPQRTHAYGESIPTNNGGSYDTSGIGKHTGATNPAGFTTPPDKSTVNENSCFNSLGIPTNINRCVKDIVSIVVYVILVVLSGILALAGFLLDESIQYTIIHMSTNLGGITGINIAWQTLRDFANMMFIFILLYVAIRTILQVGEVNAKRTLVQIIIAAILINFSIFFTKAIIDISNVFTLGFYNAMISNLPGATSAGAPSLSVGLMSIFKLGTLFNTSGTGTTGIGAGTLNTIQTWGSGPNGWSKLVGMSIGSVALIFTVTFSFLAAAFLLIFRYFVLIFLIVLSPLAFAGYVLPQTKGRASKWWDALIGQALFPVLYMIFMYVSVVILKTSFSSTTGNLGDAIGAGTVEGSAAPTNFMDIIITFTIAIMFINAALIIAKTYASQAGSVATKAMNWGLNKIDTVQTRTRQVAEGVAQRNLVNRPLRTVNKLYTRGVAKAVNSNIVKKAGDYTNYGAAATKIRTATEGGSVAKEYLGKAAALAVRGIGGATIGLTKNVIAKPVLVGTDRVIQEGLKAGEGFKMQGTENLKEYDVYKQKRDTELKTAKQQAEDETAINKGLGINLENLDSTNTKLVEVLTNLTKATTDMTVKELEDQKRDTLFNKTFLTTLNNSQFDGLMKSEKLSFTEQEKNDMKKSRTDGLTAWAKNSHGMQKLTAAQKTEIEVDKAAGRKPKNYGTFEEFIQKKKPSDIAEMPTDVIEVMAENGMITGADLEQVLGKGNTNSTKRASIRSKIETNYTTSQGAIETSINSAWDRVVEAYKRANGVTRAEAEAKFRKKSQIRITAEDVDPRIVGVQERQMEAERLEKLRRSYDFLVGTKGINF